VLNNHSEKDMYQATLSACILAVSEGFPHLSIAEIISPPHRMFDAALARQIVLHMMVAQFCWAKRRVVEEEGRSREAIFRALRTVDKRLTSPRFQSHYETIASRAVELLAARIREAA
jgi:hypothetical protein